jgi:hypothetical protein
MLPENELALLVKEVSRKSCPRGTMSVPDLTTLSKRSNGVFPVQHVYDVIDGTEILRAHGTRDMPIWGTIYRSQIEEWRFDIPPYAPEAYVQARILALIDYISRLQVK